MRILSILLLLVLINSCGLKKQYVLFHNQTEKPELNTSGIAAKIRQGDRLEIKIAGLEPESALPFYFFLGSGIQTNNMDSPPNTFIVNSKGEVSIPVIGELMVAGLQLEDAEELLRNKLKTIIKTPVVQVRIFNYMVAVLGEVRAPGYYRIQNNRITILEVLAMAGDLNSNANRKEVQVWRKNSGELKSYTVDLTSTSLFNSPVFNLEQNDVVYITPNRSGLLQPTLLRTAGPLGISLVSLILTTMTFFIIR